MVSSAPRSRHARVASLLASIVMLAGLLPAGVAAAPPSGSPTLLSPSEGATVSSNPTFSWTAVGGAVKYRVQVSTSPSFTPLVYNVDTVNVKATPSADLPLGQLYWRVAATDGGSGVGTYTDGSFTKQWGAAPTITAPDLVDTFDFPTEPVLFRWQPLAGAKSYTLEIDDAPDFVGASSFTTNNTNFTLTEPPTINQTFFWRLRATSSTGGVVTDWSETRQYDYTWTTVPTLLTPADAVGTPLRDITFSWSPVVGAKTYEIQISPNGDWDNNVIHDATIKSTKYTLSTNLDNGSYYWRVRAKDAKSTPNNGGWSNERQFTRNWPQHPDEVAPVYDGITTPIVGVPTLEWTPVPLASHYEVWIGTDLLFSAGTFSKCFTNRTKVTPYVRSNGAGGEPGGCTFPYSPGTTYYWKVRAIDGTGNIIGIFSEINPPDIWRFIYIGALPNLVNPADNATVVTPTFIWDPVPNIEQYKLTVKKQNGTTAFTVTTYATSYTPVTALNPADGPFSWYVTTIDGNGEDSVIPSSADWFHFSLTTPTPDPAWSILSPNNGGSYTRMPRMNWSDITGAAYYKVWYGVQGGLYNATPLSGTSKLPYAGFTDKDLPLPAGTYKFFIEAFDNSDVHVSSSPEWTFTITGPLALGSGDYTAPDRCTLIATCTTLADTPTISWDPVDGAGAYEVTLANDANFTNEIKRYKTVFTTLTPRESLLDQQAGQAVYWFVRACVDYGLTRCGPASDTNANDNASAFRKNSAAVELVSPPQDNPATTADNIADQITFNWTDYLATNQALLPPVNQEAKSYKIEVSLAADFSSIFDTATVDQTTYTPFSKTYPEGPLYWRVQAVDGSGNTLTKSPARLVNKTSPQITTTFPTNASTQSGVPFFQWTPQAFAATYLVEIYKNGDTLFSPANKVLSATTKFSAWAPTTSLPSGDYAWRVRRNDADGRAGPWSDARTFTLLAAAPSLTLPANAATVAANTALFTWTAVSGAVQYRIEIAATCSFSPVTSSQVTVMTAWAPITAFANGSYCWRVKALDAAGNTISTSSTRTFTIGTTPPPPAEGTTFAPVDPVRMLDTRSGIGVGLTGKFNANTARLLTVAGRLGIPNDAVAITGNVTVVGQTNAGYVSITPTLDNNPSTSALNFPTGDTRANNITSPLSGGKLSIVYRSLTGAKTDILLDVTGYFLENNSGATYSAVTPVRLLDSRSANGITGPIPTHTVKKFNIANRGGIPTDATAVTGNLTVVGQTAAGYATLGPAVTDNPTTSTINFPMGDTRANGITVRLANDGSLSLVWIAGSTKTAHFLFDVTGYYVQDLTGSKFYPLSPGRVLDTRNGTGLSGTFKTDLARTLAVEGHVGVPAAAIAVTGNLTVVGQTKAGYVSLTQTATNSPSTSTLNFPVADVRANGVTGPLSGAGGVGLVYKSSTAGASTNLILDITGYFGP